MSFRKIVVQQRDEIHVQVGVDSDMVRIGQRNSSGSDRWISIRKDNISDLIKVLTEIDEGKAV